MTKQHFSLSIWLSGSLAVSLALLIGAGCASPSGGGNGGSSGTGTGGTSAPPPPGLGAGGPFTFPQGKTSGSCTITTSASAASATMSAYNSWKSSFVTSSGAGSGLRVQSPQHSGGTVSEGMGYGMISAVYMNDRATFDGLWTYAKAHFDNNGLMNWKITSGGTTASDGTGSALDGDEDMAWALLMASDQWSSLTYLDDARAMIDAIYGTTIAGDGTLKPGDQWGGTTMFYPDYFSPAYYRVFARATSNNAWSGIIIDRGYTLIASVSGPSNGLVPNSSDTGNLTATNGTYGYNACRWPWRVAMDYCFNGEARAKTYLDKMGPFFNGLGAGNVGDGYNVTTGAQTSGNHNMAFIGPAGVAGMAGWQSLLDGAFAFGSTGAGDNAYFTNSLRVVMMLMMSGNLLDYAHQ